MATDKEFADHLENRFDAIASRRVLLGVTLEQL